MYYPPLYLLSVSTDTVAPTPAPIAAIQWPVGSTSFSVLVSRVSGEPSTTLKLQTRPFGSADIWTTQDTDGTPAIGDVLEATGLTTDTLVEWRIIEEDSSGNIADGSHGTVRPTAGTSYDARWTRWIVSSINQWFLDHIGAEWYDPPNTNMVYLEGAERKTNDLISFFELRFDGPHYRQITARNWGVIITVNVLIQHNTQRDLYVIDRMIGAAINALPASIPVYKYIDTEGEVLDCLTRGNKHTVHRYGQVKEKSKLTMVSVESTYQLEL